MVAKTEFSVKGPIFKLALELGENPLGYLDGKARTRGS